MHVSDMVGNVEDEDTTRASRSLPLPGSECNPPVGRVGISFRLTHVLHAFRSIDSASKRHQYSINTYEVERHPPGAKLITMPL